MSSHNTPTSQRLSSPEGDSVVLSNNRGASEEWLLVGQDDGSFLIQSASHKLYFLTVTSGGCVATTSLTPVRWDLEFNESESNACHVITVSDEAQGTSADCKIAWKVEFLSGELCFLSNKASDKRLKDSQMRATAIKLSTVAVCSVAGPFVFASVVGAIGFGTAGITAGSFAAGMMSAEGIVAAGGIVATLQLIGAAGLGLAGTTAALGGGAVVGGMVVGSTTAMVGAGASKTENMTAFGEDSLLVSTNRPLCAWRSW